MSFLPSLWMKRVEPQPRLQDNETALGEAVKRMVEAQMGVLRASLLARRAMLEAQGAATDSKDLHRELTARVAELDFVLGITASSTP